MLARQEECTRQIEILIDGITRGEEFAVEFFDTWGFRLGRVHREFEQYGLYEECQHFNQQDIRGKNCLAKFSRTSSGNNDTTLVAKNLSLFEKFLVPSHSSSSSVGVCVPQVCSSHDLTRLGNTYLNSLDLEWRVEHCEKPPSFGLVEMLVISMLCSLLVLNLMGTYSKPTSRLLWKFSVKNNFELFLKPRDMTSEQTIGCIDGLKVLTALWLMLGHRRDFFNHLSTMRDADDTLWWSPEGLFLSFVTSYTLGVDIFLVITAILATQSLLGMFERGKFEFIKFYVHRYFRYAPSLAVLMMLHLSSLPQRLVAGPKELFLRVYQRNCQTYWWSVLLFVQNYANNGYLCMNHTWYLSIDFQFILLCPIGVLCFWRLNGKCISIFVITLTLLAKLATYHDLKNGLRSDFFYERTQYRLGEFIIGLTTGYLMKKNRHIKIHRVLQLTACLLVTTFIFLHIFLLYPRSGSGELLLSPDNRMIYNLFARDLFSLSISWIIVFCHKLNADGAINRFLSHRCWHSMAKMCLSIYLVHYVYMTLTLANQKESYFVDSWWLLHVFAGDVVICLALALVFHLTVEVPLANLCASMMGQPRQKLIV